MLGSLTLAFALLGLAPASSDALEIDWQADPSCDDPEALQRELGRYRLERSYDAARVRVDVRGDDEGRWWVDLHLEFEDGVVDRRFSADSCVLATSATALMIAVALDPAGTLEELESEPEPELEPEPEPEPAAKPEPKPEPAPEPRPRDLGLVAQLAGQGALGPLPDFAGELFASLGLRARATRVELLVNIGFPRTVRLEQRPDAGVRLHYAAIGLRGCGEPIVARVNLGFPLCLGAEAGPLAARGFGLDRDRRSSALWLAVSGSAGISWAPTRAFGVFLAAEGWLGVVRPRTRVEGVGVVHQPGQAGVRVRAGVEFRWPNNIAGRRPS
ncbi:MAG TPA: hypothetical protein VK034_19445 [Enhygromyxa sp.]|nr:hypothetical protein [Enhygromyxa sp.]